MIITRFSPSPSGKFHIGGLRTAIFNWAYARKNGGKFYLRIDDTDTARFKQEYEDKIFESLEWIGIDWDVPENGLIYQSKRIEVYYKYIKELQDKGIAYVDDGCIRINVKKIHDGVISFNDQLLGEISVNTKEIEDFVIVRSDGMPLYNFTTVVDDVDLGITHIIRGQEHIANTTPQLLIYKALGKKPPIFCHIPFICKPKDVLQGHEPHSLKKLSKRDAVDLNLPVTIDQYKEAGYLPEALFNYLTHLGWSLDDHTEKWDKTTFVNNFSLERLIKTPARFDLGKINWLQNWYFNKNSLEDRAKLLQSYLNLYLNPELLAKFLDYCADRITKMEDFKQYLHFFDDQYLLIPDDLKSEVKDIELLKRIKNEITDFSSKEVIQAKYKEIIGKNKGIAKELRIVLTGHIHGIGLFETIELLGKEKFKKRLDRVN